MWDRSKVKTEWWKKQKEINAEWYRINKKKSAERCRERWAKNRRKSLEGQRYFNFVVK